MSHLPHFTDRPTTRDDASHVTFRTRNSTYLFTWVAGQRTGTLVGLTGTCAGDVVALPVEPFRDLAWTGEYVIVTDGGRVLFRSTKIVWTDRPEDSAKSHAPTCAGVMLPTGGA